MSGKQLLTLLQQARRALPCKIYAPASKLQKGSAEYNEVANSGRVWENHFQPGQSTLKGYVGLQWEHRNVLDKIDVLRARVPNLESGKTLLAEYAQQSVMIEDNPLKVSDAIRILDTLKKQQFFSLVGMGSMTSSELAGLRIDETEQNESSAVVELRNHIVASQWIADNAATKLGTTGVSEAEARDLAVLAVRGTDSETVYNGSRGGKVPLGGYRKLPIQVRSNHLAVFPYPQEVPACMRRFFEWRDSQHDTKELHPLILACQMTAYFVHIHPFPDGNGRTSRMIMQDYVARQGYLPVIIRGLKREEYLRMISDACDLKPREFVAAVLEAQLALVSSLSDRK